MRSQRAPPHESAQDAVSSNPHDTGALAAQLENASKRLPNLLALKARIDGGDTLSDIEVADLEDIFERVRQMLHVYDEHPEVQDLVAQVVSLYLDITTRAVENEKAGGQPPAIDIPD